MVKPRRPAACFAARPRCPSPHTLASASHDFESAQSSTASAALTPLERATFLAATRHFDEALSLWLDTLGQPANTEQQATDDIHGLREAIAVSVAVKGDPAKTLKLIDAQTRSQGLRSGPRYRDRTRPHALGPRRRLLRSVYQREPKLPQAQVLRLALLRRIAGGTLLNGLQGPPLRRCRHEVGRHGAHGPRQRHS